MRRLSLSAESRQRILTATRFGAVGVCATVIYLVVVLILQAHPFSLPNAVASGLGFAISLAASYLGHSAYTFKRPSRSVGQAAKYFAGSIALATVLSLLSQYLVTGLGVNRSLTAMGIAVAYPLSSFLLHSIWSFAPLRADAFFQDKMLAKMPLDEEG